MTRRFLVDANLPIALVRQLSASGVDFTHVLDMPGLAIPDPVDLDIRHPALWR